MLRVLDSLSQTATCKSEPSTPGLNPDRASHSPISPGSVFNCHLPLGRQPQGLFWCPDGIPSGRTTTLLSSRLGLGSFDDPKVSRAIRSFFASLDSETLLVTAAGITLDAAIQRGSQLFGINLLRFLPFPRPFNTAVANRLQTVHHDPCEFRVYFESDHYSGCDQMILETCQQTRLVSVRNNGNLHRAIRDHAANKKTGAAMDSLLLCLVDDELTPKKVVDELRTLGCHHWWLYSGEPGSDSDLMEQSCAANTEQRKMTSSVFEPFAPIIPVSELDEDLLSHWTRPVQHSWPDRNSLSQWDVVWFGKTVSQGAAGTLLRILAQQTILGSGTLIRGGRPMCCFTQVPLRQFLEKRVFRSHLSRWDFEPFGVSVRRSALESIGASPVRYANRDECDTADRAMQPWMVPSESAADWSQEREWRIAGNVDLRIFPAGSVFVFVPDMDSAEMIRPFSRWPVVVLGEAGNIRGTNSP